VRGRQRRGGKGGKDGDVGEDSGKLGGVDRGNAPLEGRHRVKEVGHFLGWGPENRWCVVERRARDRQSRASGSGRCGRSLLVCRSAVETVPPGKEAPATKGGDGPDAASPLPRRLSKDASACLLRLAELFYLQAPTLVYWPVLMALEDYAADHVVAWLLPASHQLGSEALACVRRKLRDATARMLLLTLPSVVFDVAALLRGRAMRSSPVFRTVRIAMLLDEKYSEGLLDRSAGVWRVSPPPRRWSYRQTRRRRPLPTPPPLAALPLPHFLPAP